MDTKPKFGEEVTWQHCAKHLVKTGIWLAELEPLDSISRTLRRVLKKEVPKARIQNHADAADHRRYLIAVTKEDGIVDYYAPRASDFRQLPQP